MTGTKEEAPADDGDEKGASEDEAIGKKKAPNMHRLLKSRLQKLVDKADEKYVDGQSTNEPVLTSLAEDECSPLSSWSCQVGNSGLCTTKSSRNHRPSRTSSYASMCSTLHEYAL